ncbi:hypothetical protein CR513_29934, partial [Mucuna pruriens]
MQIRRRSASRKTYRESSSWKGKDKDKDRGHIASECPNKHAMIVKDGEIGSKSFIGEVSTTSESKGLSDES